MGTKSKKFSQNIILRTFIFVFMIIMLVQVLIGSMMMVSQHSNSVSLEAYDLFENKSYIESEELRYNMHRQTENIFELFVNYRSEEDILAGHSIENEEMNEYIEELYNSGWVYFNSGEITANYEYDAYEPYAEFTGDVRKAFIDANADNIEEIKQALIERDLEYFRRNIKRLEEIEGLMYFISDGKESITNVQGGNLSADDFKKYQAYTVYENGIFESEPNNAYAGNYENYYHSEELIDDYYGGGGDDLVLCIAYTDSYIAAMNEEYTRARAAVTEWLPMVLSSLVCAVVAILWLMITTGGKNPDGTRKLYAIDKLWTEVQLAIFGCAFAGAAASYFEAVSYSYSYAYMRYSGVSDYVGKDMISSFGSIALIAAFAVCLAVAAWYMLSFIRLLKSGVFIKNSLVYKICRFLWKPISNAVSNVINGGSTMRKAVILIVLVCLLSATVFLVPVVLCLLLVFVPKWIKRFEEVQKGVDEVKSGNLTYKIPIDPDKPTDELSRLAKGINEISEASNVAVQNELKNQRMKTELISNVSHDLKTPLTSMVSYIDLLKKEGLDSPNAPGYLDILDQKTERLRKLTEDLFEAAKASSGAMPVNIETVDLLSLINQSMGEMSARIQASSLDFILNAEKDKYYVRADGQLLYRVVENLLVNVLKYAQDGSRVYIDIKEPLAGIGKGALDMGQDAFGSAGDNSGSYGVRSSARKDIVVLEIKNISKQQLNINADELMERFKRGDDSRTTEGSGLGLAIAKDLVKLMDGWFEIAIDGDLFKVRVVLDKAPAPVKQDE